MGEPVRLGQAVDSDSLLGLPQSLLLDAGVMLRVRRVVRFLWGLFTPSTVEGPPHGKWQQEE